MASALSVSKTVTPEMQVIEFLFGIVQMDRDVQIVYKINEKKTDTRKFPFKIAA